MQTLGCSTWLNSKSEQGYIEEGLFDILSGTEANNALSIVIINGPLERCYDGFNSCSTRNGYEFIWRPVPNPDPIALWLCIGVAVNGQCGSAQVCDPAGCSTPGRLTGSVAGELCTVRYCCQSQCAPAERLNQAGITWQCGLGILTTAAGVITTIGGAFTGPGSVPLTIIGVGTTAGGVVLTVDSCI
jgi:hypothetical protein